MKISVFGRNLLFQHHFLNHQQNLYTYLSANIVHYTTLIKWFSINGYMKHAKFASILSTESLSWFKADVNDVISIQACFQNIISSKQEINVDWSVFAPFQLVFFHNIVLLI